MQTDCCLQQCGKPEIIVKGEEDERKFDNTRVQNDASQIINVNSELFHTFIYLPSNYLGYRDIKNYISDPPSHHSCKYDINKDIWAK